MTGFRRLWPPGADEKAAQPPERWVSRMWHAYSLIVWFGLILVPVLGFVAAMTRFTSGLYHRESTPDLGGDTRQITKRERLRIRSGEIAARSVKPLLIASGVGLLIRGMVAVALGR